MVAKRNGVEQPLKAIRATVEQIGEVDPLRSVRLPCDILLSCHDPKINPVNMFCQQKK